MIFVLVPRQGEAEKKSNAVEARGGVHFREEVFFIPGDSCIELRKRWIVEWLISMGLKKGA